jgi:hypothetical protein
VAFLAACKSDQEAEPTNQGPGTLRRHLEQVLDGSAPLGNLYVEYDDMHAFHGGETLTVTGDTLTARYLNRGEVSPRQIEPPAIILTAHQLRALVELLLEIEAWEQRVPEREAVPDESAASLSLKIGTVERSIWEWYNDLGGNDRMVRVKQLLEEFAGPIPNESSAHGSSARETLAR